MNNGICWHPSGLSWQGTVLKLLIQMPPAAAARATKVPATTNPATVFTAGSSAPSSEGESEPGAA